MVVDTDGRGEKGRLRQVSITERVNRHVSTLSLLSTEGMNSLDED